MSDKLRNALNIAKGIQAAADAAGIGKTYDYTIEGVTFSTNRPLPDAVQKYIGHWADDPIWDIWDVGDLAIAEYEPELRVYAAVYEAVQAAAWEQRIADVSDLRAARLAFLKGDHEAAHTRAAIAQAEAAQAQAAQFQRIADALERQAGGYEPTDTGYDPRDDYAADMMDTRQRAQEQMDGLRRGMGLE